MRKMMLQWNITECLARASPACMQLGILRSLFLEPCLLVHALYSSHVAFILFVTTCVPPPSREQLALTFSVLGSDERSRRHLHPARRLSTPQTPNIIATTVAQYNRSLATSWTEPPAGLPPLATPSLCSRLPVPGSSCASPAAYTHRQPGEQLQA
jgi:hypothetical protein